MALCSNCRQYPPIVRIQGCVLCGRCFERAWCARNWHSRNIRALPGSPNSLINKMRHMFIREQAVRLRRKDSSVPAPIHVGVDIGRTSFFSRMRTNLRNLPNLFRGFFQPARRSFGGPGRA